MYRSRKLITMRKLKILKSIVDCVLLLLAISLLLATIFSAIYIMNSEILTIEGKSLFNGIKSTGVLGKIALTIDIINCYILLYSFYNFKILLEHFIEKLIFELETCALLNRIGKLLVYSSFIDIIADLILKTNNDIGLSFSTFIYVLSIGLFFLVLAEVFKMGIILKEENDLTI